MAIVDIILIVCYAVSFLASCCVNVLTFRRTGKVKRFVDSLKIREPTVEEDDPNASKYIDEFGELFAQVQAAGEISWKALCDELRGKQNGV